MNKVRLVVAAVLLLVGLLWIAQGTGTLAGGAMGGQSMWALIGAILVVAGLVLGVRELIGRPAGRS
jgi:hypothetical protein